MKKSSWIIVFGIILIGELIGIQLHNRELEYTCKPLLVPILMGYFLSQTKLWISGLKRWVVSALFFSWIGDILLIFQQSKSIFFLLGLSAFLIAHIFYIAFFHTIRLKEKIKSNIWFLVAVVAYYAVLISILMPPADMKLPVRLYGVFISFMFILALHMLYIRNKKAGQFMALGAFLFVASDSTLAMNRFYQPFEAAGIIIMLTYAFAQFFIVEGAIRYIRSANSN